MHKSKSILATQQMRIILQSLQQHQQTQRLPMSDQKPRSSAKIRPEEKQKPAKGQVMTVIVQYLTSEIRAEEATRLYTESFIQTNKLWKNLGASFDQVYSVNRGRLLQSTKGGVTIIAVNESNNGILAVGANLDLIDYLRTQQMPHNSLFLRTLGKYESLLEKDIFETMRPTLKKGDCLYNYGGAVKPQFMNGGISKKFWATGLLYAKYSGYKFVFFRATNRISSRLLVSLGGKVINTVHITEPGVDGEYMELIKTDLELLGFETLSSFYGDIKQEDSQQD